MPGLASAWQPAAAAAEVCTAESFRNCFVRGDLELYANYADASSYSGSEEAHRQKPLCCR